MVRSGVPTDFVDLSTGQDPLSLIDLIQLVGPPEITLSPLHTQADFLKLVRELAAHMLP